MLDMRESRIRLSSVIATLPVVDPMTPAEFRQLREQELGLSQDKLGLVLNKTGQTIYEWERAEKDIDPVAALAIRKLVEDAKRARKGPKRARR